MSTLHPNAPGTLTHGTTAYSWNTAGYDFKIVPDGTTNALNTAGKCYYSKWVSGAWNDVVGNSIYVDTATNTWYDGGTGTPHTITTSGPDVILQQGSPPANVFSFVAPAASSWGSGSGSGGGEINPLGQGEGSSQRKVFHNFW